MRKIIVIICILLFLGIIGSAGYSIHNKKMDLSIITLGLVCAEAIFLAIIWHIDRIAIVRREALAERSVSEITEQVIESEDIEKILRAIARAPTRSTGMHYALATRWLRFAGVDPASDEFALNRGPQSFMGAGVLVIEGDDGEAVDMEFFSKEDQIAAVCRIAEFRTLTILRAMSRMIYTAAAIHDRSPRIATRLMEDAVQLCIAMSPDMFMRILVSVRQPVLLHSFYESDRYRDMRLPEAWTAVYDRFIRKEYAQQIDEIRNSRS